MTYSPPTETNPPFTNPVTWPFPTTSERWETDYRLKLLEAAVIYMWTVGLPPGGPASGDLGGTYPAPIVTMRLPAPVTTGTAINTFTDSLGDIWVAKNGVYGGTWHRARDVLHSRIYLNNAYNTVTTPNTTLPFDTARSDVYGLWNLSQFTIPVAGVYMVNSQIMFQGTAAGQWINYWVYRSAGSVEFAGDGTVASGISTSIPNSGPVWCSVNDIITGVYTASAAGMPVTTGNPTFLAIDYLGTG